MILSHAAPRFDKGRLFYYYFTVMVYREISIMKLLHHPNIIRLYEVVDTEKVLFLIMEYASGGEVLDFIVAHGRLGEKEARRFFRQILSAIAYAPLLSPLPLSFT